MTIQVVCECGFHKEVPDKWQGMRVKCKCGRSFVISADGGIQEPPVAAPPPQQVKVPETGTAAEATVPESPRGTASLVTKHTGESVVARLRSRHHRRNDRRRLVLVVGAGVALICVGALAIILHDRLPFELPRAAHIERSVADRGPTNSDESAKTDSAKRAVTTAADLGRKAAASVTDNDSALSGETTRFRSRMADAIDLESDDGLLLTGMFGELPKLPEFSEEQATKIDELVGQVKAKQEELVSGNLDLVQWYIDGEIVGKALLGVLTDQQRTRMRELIDQGEIKRVRLEEYAARLRPELKTPIVSWKVEPDGRALPVINECLIDGTTNGNCLLTQSPSGVFACDNGSDENATYELWELVANNRIGHCRIPPAGPDDTTIVAHGGPALVRGSKTAEGGHRVHVWTIDSDGSLKTKDLPRKHSGVSSTAYQLVDCAANRVLCVSTRGFWVWNLDSDTTMEATFPEWVPRDLPKCAISPGGRYVAMAHRHSTIVDSKEYHFLEIGLYELETGELLGNQVLATDYRPMHVGAIAFSYNGRELALLWDVDPPEPKRLLVVLNAVVGERVRTVEQLPLAHQGYAGQNDLHQRALIWLPDNSGWIINLQHLVDTESDEAIDIELPTASQDEGHGKPDRKHIVDAIPAGNHRLLLITIKPSTDDPSVKQVQGQFIELPELGPFM